MSFAVAILAAAPFLGRIRDLLFERVPAYTVEIAALAFAILLGGAFLVSAARIRERRWLRYGGLAVCGVLVWLQIAAFATDVPEVDVVQRIHILQ